jgi:hypothetical protein
MNRDLLYERKKGTMGMKKKLLLSILSLLIFTSMAACSQSNGKKEETSIVPQILDVQLLINPEQGNVNEPITFSAKVLYGEEEVTDADEVEFEIWRANEENHEKVVVEHKSNGVYELEKSFSKEGTYYIYAHVTAEDMHYMPKKEFVVGQPSEPEGDHASTEVDEEHGEEGAPTETEDVHGQEGTSSEMGGHDMNE